MARVAHGRHLAADFADFAELHDQARAAASTSTASDDAACLPPRLAATRVRPGNGWHLGSTQK